MEIKITEKDDCVSFDCRITPKSKKNEIKGLRNETLLISLKAPPIENRANLALIEFISKSLKIPKRRIDIVRGLHSKNKVVKIQGITSKHLCEILAKFIDI